MIKKILNYGNFQDNETNLSKKISIGINDKPYHFIPSSDLLKDKMTIDNQSIFFSKLLRFSKKIIFNGFELLRPF